MQKCAITLIVFTFFSSCYVGIFIIILYFLSNPCLLFWGTSKRLYGVHIKTFIFQPKHLAKCLQTFFLALQMTGILFLSLTMMHYAMGKITVAKSFYKITVGQFNKFLNLVLFSNAFEQLAPIMGAHVQLVAVESQLN